MTDERKSKRLLGVLLAIPLLLFAVVLFFVLPAKNVYTVSPETTFVTGPIDTEGYVDNIAALNERLRGDITPERNANVLIWQALGPHPEGGNMPPEYFEWLGRPAPPEAGEYLMDWVKFLKSREPKEKANEPRDFAVEMELTDLRRKWPFKGESEPDIVEWLKRNKRPLELFTQASKLTEYYNPLIPTRTEKGRGMLIGCLLPNVQVCRNAALLFGCRAMLHLGEGRMNEAWDDLIASHRLGRIMERGGTLIEALVGIAIQSLAMQGEHVFLTHAKLTPELIARCRTDLNQLPVRSLAAEKVNLAERFMTLDIVQNMARQGPEAMKGLVPYGQEGEASFAPTLFSRSTDWNPTMRFANTWFDRIVAAMKAEDYQTRVEQMDSIDSEMKTLITEAKDQGWSAPLLGPKQRGELFGKMILSLTLPAFNKIVASEDRVTLHHQMLDVAFALAAYRLDQGKYPTKLADLSPKYIDKIPTDFFAGKELIYLPKANGYLLYSVGSNKMDEGGRGRDGNPPGDDLAIEIPVKEPKAGETRMILPAMKAE